MEIERKYLVPSLPEDLEQYPSRKIEQGYLNTSPVVRIRQSDDEYYLTYKGGGLLAREEYNLPLTREAYLHLRPKADGIVLSKRRYLIPLDDRLTIELDVFDTPYKGLVLAEVEFEDLDSAMTFTPPDWFGEDVTLTGTYQNSLLSRGLAAVRPVWEED